MAASGLFPEAAVFYLLFSFLFSVFLVRIGLFIPQRPFRVPYALCGGVHHDAEDDQDSEDGVDDGEQFAHGHGEVDLPAEDRGDGLSGQGQGRDQGEPELFVHQADFPVNHAFHSFLFP